MPEQVTLFVAAEAREFSGVLKKVRFDPLDWGLRFACHGELNGNKAVFIADGPGMQLAGAATDVARQHLRPNRVVSTGYCGALDPELRIGNILLAEVVWDRENGTVYPARLPERHPPVQTGAVLSMNRVAVTEAEKCGLRRSGARVVEMEAAAVALRARIWDVPFYCVRAVSDTAAQTFGIDFNRMRDTSGRFSRSRIAMAALAKPWSGIPSLVRLDRGCRRASESLGEFFANCRF